MKKTIVLLCVIALTSQAAVIEFNLSPPGRDVAVGLSPLNEVPAVTNSMGSGGELLGNNLYYDTDAEMLMLGIGYGSAAGFTNLTGAATGAHIHGPANVGEVADVVANLEPIHFVSVTGATNGGIIHGVVMVPTNSVQDLLDGRWYVNIHTEMNPGGEIRGQLVPANSAPLIGCPEDAVVECGDLSLTEIMVSDADGDEVTVDWLVNGVLLESVSVPGEAALAGTNIVFKAEYPLGTNVVEFVAKDAMGEESSCSSTVVVQDTIPPVITRAEPNPHFLWPPNHKMVLVNVRAKVEDACGDTQWRILRVTSNEPIEGTGDGNTEPDWNIVSRHSVELRAERAGNRTGRVYTIWLEATDGVGNKSDRKSVKVVVDHDQGKRVIRWFDVWSWLYSRN